MTIDELRERIDHIETLAHDPDAAHAEEDRLLREWLTDNTLYAVRKQFERLFALDFPRWTA